MKLFVLLYLLETLHTSFSTNYYTNPVIPTNNPDPSVLALPTGGYISVATSNHAKDPISEPAFPIYYSDDLVSWTFQDYVFPAAKWPVWAAANMWAPEIHFVNGSFLVYFCASAPNTRHSIGVAKSLSDSPFGPYFDLGTPLIYHNEDSVVGPIDPTYFQDPVTTNSYLVWKTDHMLPPKPSVVMLQQLNDDGLSFVEGSSPQAILQNDLEEERGIVEGMFITYKYNHYYLFYSSSLYFAPDYHMGVARSTHLFGPYTKKNDPVVETDWERFNSGQNCTWVGPGHGSVVEDKGGDWWLIYHSWQYGHLDMEPGRLMLLDKLSWHGFPGTELWPMVEGGVPSDSPTPRPVM